MKIFSTERSLVSSSGILKMISSERTSQTGENERKILARERKKIRRKEIARVRKRTNDPARDGKGRKKKSWLAVKNV